MTKRSRRSNDRHMLLIEEYERTLIAEAVAQLIIEKVEEDANKIDPLLKKIAAVAKIASSSNVPSLSNAVTLLQVELNKYKKEIKDKPKTAKAKGVVSDIANFLGLEKGKNPVLKGLTLLNSLEAGFGVLESVIKNNELDTKGASLAKQTEGDPTKLERLKKIVKNAFAPSGIFNTIKSLFGASRLPYIENEDKFISELLSGPTAPQLLSFISALNTGQDTDSIEDVVTGSVRRSAPAAFVEPSNLLPTSGRAIMSPQQLVTLAMPVVTRSKDDSISAVGARAQEKPDEFFEEFVDSVASYSKVARDKVVKVLNALFAYNKQKKSGGTTKESLQITREDVIDARIALHECRGSSANWIRLLFEAVPPTLKDAPAPTVKDSSDASDYKCVKCKKDTRGERFCISCGTQQPAENVDPKIASKERNVPKTVPAGPAQQILTQTEKVTSAFPKGAEKKIGSVYDNMSAVEKQVVLNGIKLNIEERIEILEQLPGFEEEKNNTFRNSYEKIKGSEDFPVVFGLLSNINVAIADWRGSILQKKEEERNTLLSQAAKNQELLKSLQDAASSQEKLVADLQSELSKAGEELKQYEVDFMELSKKFSDNREMLQKFVSELADELGVDKKEIEDGIKKSGSIAAYLKQMQKKAADEVAAAAQAAGAAPAAAPAAGATGRQSKALEALKNSLKDVAEDEILSVLKALPEYMIAEAVRRNKLVLI